MDVPFYHDEVLIALAASTAAAAAASEPPSAGGTSGDLAPRFASASPSSSSSSSSSRMKKDGLTLALSGELKPGPSVQPNPGEGSPASALLASPDLALLKLASPELERLIVAGAGHPLGGGRFPFPKTPRSGGEGGPDEQEFAAGFVKALEDLHHQGGAAVGASGGAGSGPGSGGPVGAELPPAPPLEPPPIYANLSPYAGAGGGYGEAPPFHAHPRLQAPAKDEPQTVPEVASFGGGLVPGASDSPPLSPIDLDTQERIKAERKRLRNRIAASKCRRRKLERISRLEEKVRSLKSQNTELASTASLLREQVAQLKQKVLSHVNSGCQLLPQAAGGAPAAAPPPVPAY